MIHRKAQSLMTPAEVMARVAATALSQTAAQQTGPSGSISVPNSDGTRTVIGAVNTTGSTMATHVGDTTPPGVPTGITASSTAGALVAAWDGTLTGGIPSDFDHVTIYATSGGTTLTLGKLAKAGSVTSAALTVGTTYAVTATAEDDTCLDDGTPAHNVSAACAAISVTVVAAADPTTEQHFWSDTDGVHVSAKGDKDTSGFNSLWTSTKLAFRSAATELMTISADLIELGKNSTRAVIKLCGGMGRLAYFAASGQMCLMGPKGAYLQSTTGCDTGSDYGLGYIESDGDPCIVMQAFGGTYLVNGTTMKANRFSSAIQPVVLYNGGAALDYDTAPGAGTTDTVTLSESAANFKELTIWGSYGGMQTATTLASPNGRECTLQLFVPNADPFRPDAVPTSWVYIKSSRLQVDGTQITNRGWVAMWINASTYHFDATSAPEIAIMRVEGVR